MAETRVGVLGATGMVGSHLLCALAEAGYGVVAYSRRQINSEKRARGSEWRRLPKEIEIGRPENKPAIRKEIIPVWISLIPVHVLPDYLPLLEDFGIRRIVVLSTTSRFTKIKSADKSERELAALIVEAEDRMVQWASCHRVEWTILQPTLIYDLGKDRNVTEIAGFIRRFGFFPVLGAAKGMRQPIAAVDVANACLQVLESPKTVDRCYVIAGRETLTYREMVYRVFEAMGKKPRFLAIPLTLFRIAIGMIRMIPRFSNWKTTMAERMNHDLTFDCVRAVEDFDFAPRRFLDDRGTEKSR